VNNFALVVGISTYQNIPRLNFADDDAYAFAEYLVNNHICQKNNVVKLIDSVATTANFYKELKKLLTKAQGNDRIFIYFAGHGDVENDIESGFLLTYNTEATNYSAGAIDIDMLEKHVNAFVKKNVKVVLITDACRSGNLVGGIAGATNTISSLSKGFQNVIKILSCQPNQLSEEHAYPDGGHGVFTYHLINGLNGLADRNNKGYVTLRDLDIYLEEVSIETNNKQIPKTNGDPQSKLAPYDNELKLAALARKNATAGGQAVASLPKPGKKRNVGDTTWQENQYFRAFNDYVRGNHLISPAQENAYHVLQQAITSQQPSALVEDMKLELCGVLEDEAQKWINKYIRGEITNDDQAMLNEVTLAHQYVATIEQLIGKADFRYNEIHAKDVFFRAYGMFLQTRINGNRLGLDLPGMINEMDESIKLLPGQPWLLHAEALLYGQLELLEKGLEKDMEALKYAPRWEYVLNSISIQLGDMERYTEALEWSKKVVATDSGYLHGWHQIGIIYHRLERYDEAIAALQKALQLDPGFVKPLRNLGEVYESQHDYERAEATMLKAIRLSPQDAVLKEDLGSFYTRRGRVEEAIVILKQAINDQPSYQFAWNSLSEVYAKAGDELQAEATLKKATAINASQPESWNALGIFYKEKDRTEEALTAYRQAARIDSFFSYAYNNMAGIFRDRGQYDSAIWCNQRLILLRPGKADRYVYTIQQIYRYNLADKDGLVKFCQWLTMVDSTSLSYREELAKALFEQGQFKEAEKSYRIAYRLRPLKKYLYSIIDCRLGMDSTADKNQVYTEVLNLPSPEAVLVEMGLHKDLYMDDYNAGIIDQWKKAKQWSRISSYLKYFTGFQPSDAGSWIDLAKQYRQHDLFKDSVLAFLKRSVALDSTASQFAAWPLLSELRKDPSFTLKAINYLQRQRKQKESYMMLYNLALCLYQAKKYDAALDTLKYARKHYDVTYQKRDDFERISDEAWDKSFER
jgi:tetratricopeptide (TPR) repeat protein